MPPPINLATPNAAETPGADKHALSNLNFFSSTAFLFYKIAM
jgi:hypothetical protein